MRKLEVDDLMPGMLVTFIWGPWQQVISRNTGEVIHVEITTDHGKLFHIVAVDLPFVMVEALQRASQPQMPLAMFGMPEPEPNIQPYSVGDVTFALVSDHWAKACMGKRTAEDVAQKAQAPPSKRYAHITAAIQQSLCSDCSTCDKRGNCKDEKQARAPKVRDDTTPYTAALSALIKRWHKRQQPEQ